jgi:hypothetical protein
MGRRAAAAVSTFALLAFVSDASGQAPAPRADTATDTVVLSRIENTQTVEADDLRLVLSKHRREEHAVVRRLIFIAASLRLTEPTPWAGDGPPPRTCRFEYKSFLQRQQCFVSLSGVMACTQAEVTPLPDEAHGDAPAPADAPVGFCNDVFRPAVNARVRLSALLRERAAALFAADQKDKVDPLFRAAGLSVRPDAPPAPRGARPAAAPARAPK